MISSTEQRILQPKITTVMIHLNINKHFCLHIKEETFIINFKRMIVNKKRIMMTTINNLMITIIIKTPLQVMGFNTKLL